LGEIAVLTASFFSAVFASLCWIAYIGIYLSIRLSGVSIGALGLTDLFIYTAIVVLPLFVIWSVWGYVYKFADNRLRQKQFQMLWQQQQQTFEYIETVGRILLQAEQNRQDDFIVGRIDLFIAEMNELLSDLMERYSLASADKIKIMWSSVKNGNRWGFAKAIIELKNTVENFEAKLLDTAKEDALLTGIINEFCARYTSLIELLKKHDREKAFLNIIETGALGRVFAIFAPLSDTLGSPQEEAGLIAENPIAVCSEEDISLEPEEDENTLPELMMESDFSADDNLPENSESKTDELETDDIFKEDNATEEAEEKDILSILGAVPEQVPEEQEEKPVPEQKAKSAFKRPAFKLPKLSEIFKRQKQEDPDDWIRPQGDIDPLTLALERSFGRLSDTEPLHNITAADASKVSDPVTDNKFAFANTDKTIKSLQKEWEEMKKEKIAEPEEESVINLTEELEEIQIADPEDKAVSANDKN